MSLQMLTDSESDAISSGSDNEGKHLLAYVMMLTNFLCLTSVVWTPVFLISFVWQQRDN